MATITAKNISAKALMAHMAKAKKTSARAKLEWEHINTNSQRGHVYDQAELNKLYSRDDWAHANHGASKTCHINNYLGERFKYIVIKRHKTGGYLPRVRGEHKKCTGNQLVDEINCWLEFAALPESDLLCPILKYFTSKSDKVTAKSETMQKNVLIIAQKAEFVGDADDACRMAERMNNEHGYIGEGRHERYKKLERLSAKQGWRDAMFNGGNSGVIFDYAKGCYKAVFIDYAL